GMLIPIVLIIIASFPPIPGYGTVSVLCGFVYDFPIGFIPPLIGGIIGASSCFVVSRKYGQTYIRKLLAHYTYIEAAMKAIEIKGTKLLFLVRVAPYPWTIMNFVLGATKIPYTKFILATTLSLPKLLFHVYLGASAKSL
ncbi:snare associated Golgi protein, partial [Neoconidiobolus thromboides FSU 785]